MIATSFMLFADFSLRSRASLTRRISEHRLHLGYENSRKRGKTAQPFLQGDLRTWPNSPGSGQQEYQCIGLNYIAKTVRSKVGLSGRNRRSYSPLRPLVVIAFLLLTSVRVMSQSVVQRERHGWRTKMVKISVRPEIFCVFQRGVPEFRSHRSLHRGSKKPVPFQNGMNLQRYLEQRISLL